MKAPVLSVARPWSTWLAAGIKDIENRTWTTNYRGPMWIHAAKSWNDDATDIAEQILGDWVIEDLRFSVRTDDHPTGILALVDLTGVCERGRDFRNGCAECGPWAAHGQYHMRIANPRPLTEPIPARGRLGLWRPDPDLQTQLDRALDLLSTGESQ